MPDSRPASLVFTNSQKGSLFAWQIRSHLNPAIDKPPNEVYIWNIEYGKRLRTGLVQPEAEFRESGKV
jgi:hypothetical protein